MGEDWAERRREAGRAHRQAIENPLGQPRCRLCGGLIEGELVSVAGTTKGSIYYHGWCYEDRWAHIMHRMR